MASRPPRVFLDASVLIAATLSPRGFARDLITLGFRQDIDLIISSDVIDECARNIGAKVPTAIPRLQAFLALLPHRVEPTPEDVRRTALIVEAKDAPIVAAANRAHASALATYDRKHLLAKRAEILAAFGLTVATPEEILRQR